MRKIIILMFLGTKLAQAQVSEYQQFDIKSTSGEVILLISEELNSSNRSEYEALVSSKKQELSDKIDLLEPLRRAKYGEYINTTLVKARNLWQSQQKEIVSQVSPEYFSRYGIDALSKHRGINTSKFTDNLLMPLMQSGFNEYASNEIRSSTLSILNNQPENESLISSAMNYVRLKGLPLDASSARLRPELRSIAMSVANTEQLKYYTESILEIITSELEKALPNAKSNVDMDLETATIKLKENYNIVLQGASKKTNTIFQELGNSVEELTINEVKLQDTIDQLKIEWDLNRAKLAEKEKILWQASKGSDTFIRAQSEHARIVVQNQIRLDLINSYVNKGIKVIDTAKRLKISIEKVFDAEQKAAFLEKLDVFELPTLTGVISGAESIAGQLNAIFPNNKSVQQVAKFTNYASKAVTIGLGVASIFAGNPLGALSVVSGIGGLLGGPPPESPELMLIKQLRQEIQSSFQEVNQKLDLIEQKLDDLISVVQLMYKDMMRSFQVINDKLEDIDWKLDGLISLSQTAIELLVNVADCRSLYQTYQKTQNLEPSIFSKFNGYSALYQADASTCQKCLSGLKTHTNIGQGSLFSMSYTIRAEQLIPLVRDRFGKTRTLFEKLYGNSPKAINALFIPAERIEDSQQAYVAVNKLETESIDGPFETFYNYALLAEFTDWITDLSPFFLISTSVDYEPLELKRYFQIQKSVRVAKISDLQTRLHLLLTYINDSLLQQSLLAGNLMMEDIYQILYGYLPNDPANEMQKLTLEVLKNNKLLAKNFSSRMIFNAINSFVRDDKNRYVEYSNLFYTSLADNDKLAELNDKYSDSNFDFVKIEGYGNILLQLNGKGGGILLPVADPAFIISNQMAQSDGFYALLKAKEKIMTKLTDLGFPSQLSDKGEFSSDQMKYILGETITKSE